MQRSVVIVIVIFGMGCSVNILKTFSNQTSNEALYVDAQQDLNGADYNGALSKIGQMTGAYATSTKVLELKASAYGGLCGFQFITFVQSFAGIGATRLFPFLLGAFDASVSTDIDNCVLAQNTLLSIGAPASLSADDNTFLAMIAFAKIGNILSYYADKTHTGTATAGFDPCTTGGSRGAPGNLITDADAREIGTGISLALAGLQAVAGSVQLGSGSLSNITSICSALPSGSDFCTITDPAAFTANEILGIRSLVNEDSIMGLGSNCHGDVIHCACP